MVRHTRRTFVIAGGSALSAALIAACGGSTPTPTTAPPAPTSAPPTPTRGATPAPTAAATAAATTTAASPTPAAATGTVPPRPTRTSATAEIEVLSFYGRGSPDWTVFEWINSEFTKRYAPNVTVKLTQANQQNNQLRLQNGNPAEIGNVAAGYAGFVNAIPYLEAGHVYNLQNAMQQESWDTPGKSWWDTINPIVRPLLQVPGYPGIWSFPREVTSLVFFYNKKHFQTAGVEPPTTWSELVQVCEKLKSAGIVPFTQDGTSSHGYMEWWLSESWSKIVGNDYLRETILGMHSFTEPEFVEGAKMVRELVDKGYFVQGFEGMDHTGSQVVFYQGNAAMVLVGSWLIGEMRNAIPKGFEQDVFRFPMVEGGKGNPKHLFGTSNILGIAAKSKHPELAVEWARWFNSVEVNNRRTEELQWQSAILGVQSPTFMPNVSKIFEESTKMDIFSNGDLVGVTKDAATRYYELVGRLFSKQLKPADFCKQIDDNFRGFFKKNPDVLNKLQPFVKGIPST